MTRNEALYTVLQELQLFFKHADVTTENFERWIAHQMANAEKPPEKPEVIDFDVADGRKRLTLEMFTHAIHQHSGCKLPLIAIAGKLLAAKSSEQPLSFGRVTVAFRQVEVKGAFYDQYAFEVRDDNGNVEHEAIMYPCQPQLGTV